MYIFTPNVKFLCLIMSLGGLYTDDDDDNDARRTKHDCMWQTKNKGSCWETHIK